MEQLFAKLLSSLLLATLLGFASSAGDFDYGYGPNNGPSVWGQYYPDCNGTSNSPIDIIENDAEPKNMGTFEFTGLGTAIPQGATLTVRNAGHTVNVEFPDDGYYVSGGGLPTKFKSAQFHLHWGNTSAVGSEHFLNGMPYAAELHLVNYNYQKYSTVVEALDKSDGLAVLGFFIEVGDEDNPAFQPLIDSLVNVTYPGTTLQLETPFPILPLFPENVEEFYRYDGGLTSPGCFESVVWTVMKNPVSISEEQMAAFRQLRESASGEPVELMLQNFRPPRPLNERTVYVNDLQVGDASSIRPILTVLLLSSVLALLSQ